jgi:hypothetical protein
MEVSPSAPKLYRKAWRTVISTVLVFLLVQVSFAQITLKKRKGPRAIGLLQLAANGKGHLIPVAILIDGQYYDARAYKANPVPMALESGTVYEAISTGVSEGLFTVAGAVQANNSWLGEGTWQAAGSAPAKKVATPTRPPDEDRDAPPVLRRSAKPVASAPEATPPETKTPEPEKKPEAAAPAAAPEPAAPAEDPDRPVLHRGGRPEESAKKPPAAEPAPNKPSAPAAAKAEMPADIKTIPAISDATVQEPRSFEFKTKPEEEEQFRKKMLAIAVQEVNARAKTMASSSSLAGNPAHPAKSRAAAKPAPPALDDLKMRIFDLTSSNEPILVLTATAHGKSPNDLPQFVTLVARNNIYGELKKVFSSITDAQHLDVVPQMQLVDVVDADGDGRGELLFRRSSDSSSAYGIYRVIGTQLFPLFEGRL